MTENKVKIAMERLEEGIESLLQNGQWADYLRIQSRFHNYSFANIVMILLQCPNATRVAGFNRWKQLGRFVKKGEKGIAIFAPIVYNTNRKKSDEDEDETDSIEDESKEKQKKARTKLGYKLVYIYDEAQTDGKPLPSQPSVGQVQGECGWYETIKSICEFPVVEVDAVTGCPGALGAFFHSSKQIEIVKSLGEAEKASVLIHEYAHGLLHDREDPERPRDLATREFEAESTAYVVGQALGFDTSKQAFDYILMYNGEDAVAKIKSSGARVQKAASKILSALEPYQSALVESDIPQIAS